MNQNKELIMGFFDFLFGKAKNKAEDMAPPPPPPAPVDEVEEEEEEVDEDASDNEPSEQDWSNVQAMADAAHAEMRAKQAAAMAANPALVAPVDGVTVENWAQAAAMMASTPDAGQQMQKLAALGMDRARYEKANNEFQARMQGDQTAVIATIFGNAFAAAQNVNMDGPEPISFEKYGELAGAQAAWGEMGMDVNRKLQEVFGITAVDVSNYGSYWSNRFMKDVQLAMKHGDLLNQYKAKFMAGGTPDDDIDI
ncbi:MAG: hypothetical protein CVU65_01265 [Deltaproteobacteria bacterium HGW-Deltaproteobacteria-22]|nr:MAG: hypothetical protein CVU65_01265 [Deltaproteobacteria bacterium HGW-Deltaproteobacteria-22]